MRTLRFPALLSLAGLCFTSSCTLIADVNSYDFDDGCDLDMSLTDFGAHFGGPHRMEFFIIEPDTSSTKSVLVLDPTPAVNFDINVPNAIPTRRHEIRFYADQNNNGIVETVVGGMRIDHTWTLANVCPDDPILFRHTLEFQDFPEPGPIGTNLTVNVSNMEEAGGAFELRAIVRVPRSVNEPNDTIERTVGAYHRPTRDNGTGGASDPFTAVIPAIIDSGVDYILEVWADGNGNGAFDRNDDGVFTPGDDRHYRFELTGTALLSPFELDVSNSAINGQTDHSGIIVVTPR